MPNLSDGLLTALLLLTCCSSTASSESKGDAGTDAASIPAQTSGDAPDGGGPLLHDSGANAFSSAPCDAYIACVAETTPQGLSAILAAYGKDGTCWRQGDTALCDNACRTGLVATHKLFPEASSCNACDANADCPSRVPACDRVTNKCVECGTDSDCHGALPACDTSSHTCVGCLSDAHCPNPSKPRCDLATRACVACASSSDCQFGEICDTSTKSCRGCRADSDCPSGACSQGVCVQCKSDAQCGGATPHCGPNGACIQCTSDSECGAGICSFGTCCGQTACASAGAQCGETIDLQCSLFPIPCGACPQGNTCVNHQCQPTPPKCTPQTCSKGCTYVPEHNDYECLNPFPSCGSNNPCNDGFFCETFDVNGTTYHECRVQCLDDTDCSHTSGTCKLLQGPTSYGYCG